MKLQHAFPGAALVPKSHPGPVVIAPRCPCGVQSDSARTIAGPRELLLGLALILLLAHTLLLGDWLVDDAGISFAYARNLALGFGLVSQPGLDPVEGFSNPLWTACLSLLFLTETFADPWTVKILSLCLLGATFLLVSRSFSGNGAVAWLAASPPVFLALSTSFVVWTTSGLENPLLAFLVALSATLAVRAAHGENGRLDIAAGLVGGLLALTRPDAIVYAVAYPLVVCCARSQEGLGRLVRRGAAYGLALGTLFGGYLVFRRLYFHDWVPNTFHAKVRPWLLEASPSRLLELLDSANGRLSALVLLILAGVATSTLGARRWDPRPLVLMLYLALAALAYLLLPPDWMQEYRFATAFFLLFYWLLGDTLADLWERLASIGSRVRWLILALALLLLGESTAVHAPRSAAFAANPTVPFARISEFALAYDRLADSLGPGQHSLLAPDLGGPLFHGHLRMFDLAGLCDRTIARTLMNDGAAFHEYVFETARPTFIHVHSSWAAWAALHADPRFVRDYEPIFERWPGEEAEASRPGEPLSGDYVRREAVLTAERLERLRNNFAFLGLRRPLP